MNRRLTQGGAWAVAGLLTATTMGVAPAAAGSSGWSVATEAQLRTAVAQANQRPGTDTITLKRSIRFSGAGNDGDGPEAGDLDVTDALVVRGNGHSIDAAGLDRHFDVASGASLLLRGVTLRGGAPADGASGGAVRSAGTLVVEKSRIRGNEVSGAGASGGAVFNDGGRLTVRRSDLSGNSAERAGGAIEALEGRTWVRYSRLSGNSTGAGPGNGGALHLTGAGVVVVHGSKVHGNTAAAEGGGLWNSETGSMTVTRSLVSGNRATGAEADNGGGGIFNDGGVLRVKRSVVAGNDATGTSGSGGGLLNDGGTLSVSASHVRGNAAMRAGGGIEAVEGSTTLQRVSLVGNRAGANPGNGGGLHLTGAGEVGYDRGRVAGNVAASEGGGLWNSATGTMVVRNVTLTRNVARGDAADNGGGALFNDGGTLIVRASTLKQNSATGEAGSGGGIFNNAGDLRVYGSGLRGNTAVRAGGGVETLEGEVLLRRVALRSNRAGDNPGNGGGLHTTGAGSVDYERGQVIGNRAANEGGGLWNSSTGTMVVVDVRIAGNRAPVGAQVFNQPPGGTFTVDGEPVPAG